MSEKGLTSKKIKTSYNSTPNYPNHLFFKKDKGSEERFFPRRCINGHSMLGVTNHEGHTMKTRRRLSPHTCQNGYY